MRVFAGVLCGKEISNDNRVARHAHLLRSHVEVYLLSMLYVRNRFAGRRFRR